MPEISVIVPNYNHGRFLEKRMKSILHQTFSDFEIILLDDCSSDNSREILGTYGSHPSVTHYVCNTKNSGSPFAQWERGIRLAKGKWIWIAESDDESDSLFLERLFNLATQHENVGIAFASSLWIDQNSEKGADLSLYDYDFFRSGKDEIQHELWKHCTIPNASAALIRADLALKCVTQLWKFKGCGDWMFYIRILNNSNIVHTAEKLNHFRWYHTSTSTHAQARGLWVTEGVRLLQQIDQRTVKFSPSEMSSIINFWLAKCKTVRVEERFGVWRRVGLFTLNWKYYNGFDKHVLKALIKGTLLNLRRGL